MTDDNSIDHPGDQSADMPHGDDEMGDESLGVFTFRIDSAPQPTPVQSSPKGEQPWRSLEIVFIAYALFLLAVLTDRVFGGRHD